MLSGVGWGAHRVVACVAARFRAGPVSAHARAQFAQDALNVVGLSSGQMVFGAITASQTFFTCNVSQGIMGMAYMPLSISEGSRAAPRGTQQVPCAHALTRACARFPAPRPAWAAADGVAPIMDVFHSKGTPNGFALQLCGRTSVHGKSGNFWIGGYDSTFTSAAMRYVQIVQKTYYVVNANSFNINGVTISGASISGQTSIIDTGWSTRRPSPGRTAGGRRGPR